MNEKICGIYCVENMINRKKYVGLSKDCLKRWSDHYSKSYHSTKEDEIRKPLYMAMRKYGRENFKFYMLEECEYNQLKEKEIEWIQKLNSYKTGYNATLGGDLPEGYVLRGDEHCHVLTEEEVIKCRKWYAEGRRSREIYDMYFKDRITYGGFQKMWFGESWKHVMPEVFEVKKNTRKKFDDDTIRQIKQLFKEGKTCAEVFHMFDRKISRTTINDIFNGRRYKEIN